MPEVTGYTTDKVDALLASVVVSGVIDNGTGELTLVTKDGTQIDAGSVVGAIGDATISTKGLTQLATDVETAAGAVSTKAVTPFGLAATVSSATARGLVELATGAETITGTDATRAVTPAGLTAVRVVSGIAESAAPTSYPAGTSSMALTSSTWSLNSGSGLVVTNVVDATHAEQTFYANAGGTNFSLKWSRTYHTTDGGGGWTAWELNTMVATLAAASFTQTTAFTSYPLGTSRIYFTTSNASSWDFTGKPGELVTFRDGTDFAVQTWRWHAAGSGNYTETWSRTANAASGWSRWTKMAQGAQVVKQQSVGAVAAGAIGQFTVTLPHSMLDTNYVVSGLIIEKNDGTFGAAALCLTGAIPLTATTFRIQVFNADTAHATTGSFISYIAIPVQG
jgi:hypothetical protein